MVLLVMGWILFAFWGLMLCGGLGGALGIFSFLFGILLIILGAGIRRREKHFRRYADLILNQHVYSIVRISELLGISPKIATAELLSMIKLKILLGAVVSANGEIEGIGLSPQVAFVPGNMPNGGVCPGCGAPLCEKDGRVICEYCGRVYR